MNKPTFNTMKVLRRIALAVAATAVFGAAPVWATPVNAWGFNVTSVFSSATDTDGSAITPTNSGTKLSWGIPMNSQNTSSSLVIDPSNATGSVNTYFGGGTPPPAFVADVATLTHNNFVIKSGSPALQTAVLSNTITLAPPGLSDYDFSFGIRFKETTNQPGGACPVGMAPCPDIFVIDNSSFNQPFTYDGENYFLSFFALDNSGLLGTLPDAACEATGASTGCYGFITKENASTPMRLGLAITSHAIGVPEPGSLLLMGAGLFGIGFAIRRRKLSIRR